MTKVTGELISIDDSAYDGFKGMTIYGKTVQNLWVNPSGTQNGVTMTSNDDGSVTVSGTSTASVTTYFNASHRIYALKPETTYTLSVDKAFTGMYASIREDDSSGSAIATNSVQSGALTFQTKANMASCLFFVSVAAGSTVSGTYRIMLNEGSEAQPWCPPGLNGVDELSIITAGKNLFDGEFPTSRIVSLGVLPPGRYTVSMLSNEAWWQMASNGNRIFFKDKLPSMAMQNTVVGQRCYGTFTNPVMQEVALTDFSDDIWEKCSDFQLELGSTATAYEPPNITTTPIDLQGHTLNALPDGTSDELHIDGGGNVVLEKRTGVYIADGDEGWELSATSDAPYRMKVDNWSKDVENDLVPFNRFQADRLPKYSATPTVGNFIIINGRFQLYAARNGIQDASAFSEWLKSNPMTVIYKLSKPQTIQLGKISLPKLRKKPLVNNVWANGTAEGTGFSLAPEIDYKYNRWSTYCDGFRTHGKHSYFDMGCCIAARDTGTPEKKSVTATVPYMSGFYDLSKLYGAIAFEARELMYRFEFVEDSRDELQQRKSQFLEWLSQVHDEEIADDDIPGRHFIGSLSEWEFEEGEEGQSGSLEVTFNCQPFLEADEDTTKTCNAGSNTVTVAGQAVNVYAKTSSGTATIRIGGVTQSVGTTEIRLSVQLQPGDNAVTVTGSPVVLRWKELTV